MWKTPIYKFNIPVNGKREDIFIDVTGSAPSFETPGKQLEGTFKNLLVSLDPKKTKILDFGAAKLRNTIYLLKKGFSVFACEYDDLFKRSKQASDYYELAKKYKNFKKIIYPNDFINGTEKFDVVLLINVLNIMPIPLERLYVLSLCRQKIHDTGRLLWYTQHGAYSENKAVAKLYDGLVTGKSREYKMFYRDFSQKEIFEMLKSTGFSHNSTIKFPSSGGNQAYCFNPSGEILLNETLKELKLSKQAEFNKVNRDSRWTDLKGDSSKKISYETKVPSKVNKIIDINILQSLKKELTEIKPGKNQANKYHDIIYNILIKLFEGRLQKPKKEEVIANQTKRVDITFKNTREKGFFKELANGYNFTVPNIFIECKNYQNDPVNPEFDQLAGRLNKIRGQFGILICRKISNQKTLLNRLADFTKDYKYIIVLQDYDMMKLITFKLAKKEEKIDDYLEEKLKMIT